MSEEPGAHVCVRSQLKPIRMLIPCLSHLEATLHARGGPHEAVSQDLEPGTVANDLGRSKLVKQGILFDIIGESC